MPDTGLYIALGYFALFIFGSHGLLIWRFRRRGRETGARSE